MNETPMLYWDKPTIIAPEKPLKDKQLVWAWNNDDYNMRNLGFYDKKK